MANAELIEEDEPKKKGKMGLILAFLVALVTGGGGFFAAFSGMLPFGTSP